MYHNLFIHSPTQGHLSCFQVLTIMNDNAINIQGQVFLCEHSFQLLWLDSKDCDLLDYMVRVKSISCSVVFNSLGPHGL